MSIKRETEEARQIKVWMRQVREAREWSWEHWGKLADVNPSIIQRFIKDGYPVPKATTIAKLARVAGSMPRFGSQVMAVPDENTVPLIALTDIKKPKAAKRGKISTMQPVSDRAFATEVESRALDMHGIRPGDVVICEPADVQQPRRGDVVFYAEGESFELGIWEESLIVHHGSEGRPSVPAREAEIVAVAVEVRRGLGPQRQPVLA